MSLTDPFIDQICRTVLWRYLDPASYDWFVAYEMADSVQRAKMDGAREKFKRELLGPYA